jgi:predicted cupin superfamily sugar epimerase
VSSRLEEIREKFELEDHPEGGFYRRIYASNETWQDPEDSERRLPAATSIHYLLGRNDRSRLHRLKSDELWFFHEGGELEVFSIDPSGKGHSQVLSLDSPMVWVKAGAWFGSRVVSGEFLFCSCVVAPGFRFEDFELASSDLAGLYPEHAEQIRALT